MYIYVHLFCYTCSMYVEYISFGACLLHVIRISTSRFTNGAWVWPGNHKQWYCTVSQNYWPSNATGVSLFCGLILVAHCLWKFVCRRPVCASPWELSPTSSSSCSSLGSLWSFFLWQYTPATIRFNNTRIGRHKESTPSVHLYMMLISTILS